MMPTTSVPPPSTPVALRPRPQAARRRATSLIDVRLDPAQRGAVTLPPGRSLLVLGEAGHGKTTVALHRIAHLWRQMPAPRACVIVPTEGLARWLRPLLPRLGADVDVLPYDRWAADQARRAFRGLPDREGEDGTPAVARMKRHPGVGRILDEIALRPGSARARRSDLLHLFGDRALLDRVAAAAPGTVTTRMIEDTLDHTRVQFSRTTEQQFAHVFDRRRLVAVDGRSLDDGTASGDAGSIDVEDYAVLFEIDRVRARLRGVTPKAPRAYDLLMVDEAQELAPLEAALIGRSLAPGGTLVVAGDAAQQIDPSVTFTSWDTTMQALGCPEHACVELAVGYRCPPDVAAVARHVLDPTSRPAGGREEHAAPPPEGRLDAVFDRIFADELQLAAWTARELSVLARRDRSATTAVICRSPLLARRLVQRLRAGVPARLVLDGSFLVRGGVQVTTVDQVKGLEFDNVVVPDASRAVYPDEPASARALYVAVTRTKHQLVLACVGERSPLLPPARPVA
jgi:hypothetical protein